MVSQVGAPSAAGPQYYSATQQIWRNAWHAQKGECCKSLCAKIACIAFPIIFTVIAIETVLLIGRKIVQLFTKPTGEGEPIVLLPPIKVDLKPGSRQMDIVDNPADPGNRRPPACTFHSLIGASTIAEEFEKYVQWIESQDTANLSAMQRNCIIYGTGQYFGAIAEHREMVGGADVEGLQKHFPNFFIQKKIYLQNTNQDPLPVAVRAAAIVEHLFNQDVRTQMAWIKNGNDESFSVVCKQGKAIVFDSHKSSIYLIRGKEQTQRFLTENLTPFAEMRDGSDLNAFSYALGYVAK